MCADDGGGDGGGDCHIWQFRLQRKLLQLFCFHGSDTTVIKRSVFFKKSECTNLRIPQRVCLCGKGKPHRINHSTVVKILLPLIILQDIPGYCENLFLFYMI